MLGKDVNFAHACVVSPITPRSQFSVSDAALRACGRNSTASVVSTATALPFPRYRRYQPMADVGSIFAPGCDTTRRTLGASGLRRRVVEETEDLLCKRVEVCWTDFRGAWPSQ